MSRKIEMVMVWGSPIVLTLACIGCGVFLGLVKNAIGSSKSSGPIVIAAAILWMLHAGYLMGPWLWTQERRVLAISLMVPIALTMLLALVVFGGRIASNPTGPRGDQNYIVEFMLVLIAAMVVYGGPIVAFAMKEPGNSTGTQTTRESRMLTTGDIAR